MSSYLKFQIIRELKSSPFTSKVSTQLEYSGHWRTKVFSKPRWLLLNNQETTTQITGYMANLLRSGKPTKLSVDAEAFIDQQMQKIMTNLSGEVFLPTIATKTWRSENFQVSYVLTTDRRFKGALWTWETKMVKYVITSKLNSTFGTIGKATGVKMTAKAVRKNLSSCFSVFQHVVMEQSTSAKFGIYSLKCWFSINVWKQGCWFDLEARKMFISCSV